MSAGGVDLGVEAGPDQIWGTGRIALPIPICMSDVGASTTGMSLALIAPQACSVRSRQCTSVMSGESRPLSSSRSMVAAAMPPVEPLDVTGILRSRANSTRSRESAVNSPPYG